MLVVGGDLVLIFPLFQRKVWLGIVFALGQDWGKSEISGRQILQELESRFAQRAEKQSQGFSRNWSRSWMRNLLRYVTGTWEKRGNEEESNTVSPALAFLGQTEEVRIWQNGFRRRARGWSSDQKNKLKRICRHAAEPKIVKRRKEMWQNVWNQCCRLNQRFLKKQNSWQISKEASSLAFKGSLFFPLGLGVVT